MSSWSEELDKLKKRVEKLHKKIDGNPDSMKRTGEVIDANLEEIKKYLEASEEIIQREASEHPKIKKSYDELEKQIIELETKLDVVDKQYKQLQEKSNSMKLTCAMGGALGGAVGGIAIWKVLPRVKKWLGIA